MPIWTNYEEQCAFEGYNTVCGIDEAGRGPLAGPVFAAAVVLPRECVIEGLDDSKKLSEKEGTAFRYNNGKGGLLRDSLCGRKGN